MTIRMGTETARGRHKALDDAAIADLARHFRGPLIRPPDPRYDAERRIWNGAIDRRPDLIARCTGAADVRAAVRFARERELLVAVRGGGHNVAGTAVCDGGIVIDLSPMKGMRVDPRARVAKAQPGLLWGEFDHETQSYGLATPGGIVTHTGIAGLTLGGGLGWLMRRHGLTADNLLSADVITADGSLVHASAEEHADLFWGLRGGGGNFGIVTSFEYRLHAVGPNVLAGVILHPAARAREVLKFYRDFIAKAPDELMTILALRMAPPAPFLPESIHGQPVVIVAVCCAGTVEDGERALAPLRRFGKPLVDLIRPTPYASHQAMLDAGVPHGLGYYWKSEYLRPLSDDLIETLVAHAWRVATPESYSAVFHMGGAVSREDPDGSAFEDRRAAHAMTIDGVWSDPAASEACIAWTREFWEAVRPHSTGRVYMNFLGEEGQDRVRAAYGAAKYERLRGLKRKYDPTNFFRMNQNIVP
ncbi:MAG TPA: FAD-binding oxidoreductase [Candidatus Eisenbacteria bacterium]|nr:FAD-binding oxidoreductase [Candidatus Eisenbacteria bacterium]